MTKNRYHTKEEAIQAVTKDGTELGFCSTKLKNDKDVVMAAIKQNSWAFEYASILKSNKPFIMKAINDGVDPWWLIQHASIALQSDIEVITFVLEKSRNFGADFKFSKGDVALNKELAAKALVKWGNKWGAGDSDLWDNLHPTLKVFFPIDSFYEKAKTYLYQLEQERQAELVSGGSTAEDEVVW